MASQALRADATLEVTPPPVRVIAAARVGLFYNLSNAVGPAVFLEALRPLAIRNLQLSLGGTIGYMRAEIDGTGPEPTAAARLETDQFPILALAPRARAPAGAVRGERRDRRGNDAGPHQVERGVEHEGFEAIGSAYAPGRRGRRGGGADAEARTPGDRAALSVDASWGGLRRGTRSPETVPD